MIRRVWPALVLLCAACSNGFWTCGAYTPCCHTTPSVMRDVTYFGSLPVGDGGVPTQVKLVVGTNGNTRL